MVDEITRAVEILKTAKTVAVLTGAGVSAESNIPTFRGEGGLWKKYRAEELATPEAFNRNPELVWEWYGYRQKLVLGCRPNPAHEVIEKMEDCFDDFLLITQNVDGLHRRAGSKKMLELHGNLFKSRCTVGRTILDFTLGDDPLPKCESCGALLRPHIVWFGESPDPMKIQLAVEHSEKCDVFLVIGTSAMVQPAAYLPLIAKKMGAKVIEINPKSTPITNDMDVSIRGKAGEILPEIWTKAGF
ncbi:MAG: NAD-dependent deacylase [Candidatus Eremiobacteraeota bacterium]|nr:NAD-dependent deacylase [Candidatus Eremiobacteraeota bacterium]